MWDIEVETDHSFIAQGFVNHNSTGPAIQNISRDPDIRNMFIAPPRHKLIDADYSQAEVRWLAHYSKDKELMAAFQRKHDIHTETAVTMMGLKAEEVTKDQRAAAKAINFGLIYGRGTASIAEFLKISEDEAQQLVDTYFSKMPEVKTFIERTHRQAEKDGYIQNFFGRRRRFPFINTQDKYEKAHMLRQVVNSLIQGSAADATFVAINRIQEFINKNKLKSRIILTVHDSIITQAPDNEVKMMAAKIKELMEAPIKGMRINLVADVDVDTKWGVLSPEDQAKHVDKLKATVKDIYQEFKKLKPVKAGQEHDDDEYGTTQSETGAEHDEPGSDSDDTE